MERISRKLLVSALITITIISLCFVKPTQAATGISISDVNTAKYETISNVSGEKVVCTSYTDKIQLFIVSNTTKIQDENYGFNYDLEGNAYYEKCDYKLYYTSDGTNYGRTEVNAMVNELYSLNNDERIILTSIQEKGGMFYICGSTAKKAEIEKEDGTYVFWDYTAILLKTADGKNFEKIDIPTYKGKDTELCKYKNTYIMTGEYYGEEGENYNYYTSTDLNSWTKREIPNLSGAKLQNITSAGVTFIYGSIIDSPENILTITSDFENYKVLTQDEIQPDSSAQLINGNPEKYEEVRGFLYKFEVDNKFDSLKHSYCFTGICGISPMVFIGADFYISPEYPGEYKKFLEIKEEFKDINIIDFSINSKADNEDCPLLVFVYRENADTSIFLYDSYKKSDYIEYRTNLNIEGLKEAFGKDVNETGFVYGNKNMIFTKDKYKNMYKMETPIEFNDGVEIIFDNKILLLGTNNSAVMKMDDIFDTVNFDKLGDIDGNGKITTKDAKMILQHIVKKIKLTDEQQTIADVDGNGKMTTKDAKLILQYIVKKITKFPVEK